MMKIKSLVVLGAAALGFAAFGEQPDEFIEYIQSDATQYFDTGVIGKCYTKAEIDFMQVESPGLHGISYLGCRQKGNNNTAIDLWYQNYGYGFFYCGNFVNNITRENFERRKMLVTLEKGKQTAEWNGKTWTKTVGTELTTDLTMYLFARNDDNTPTLVDKPMRLYSLKIWQKATAADEYALVRDYRPCRHQGSVGLYDAVNDEIISPKDASGNPTTIGPYVHTVKATTQGGMTPIQQLTNAFTKVGAGDIIRIEPGVYTFDAATYMGTQNGDKNRLQLTKSGVTVIGMAATPRKSWTYGEEPVVINANGGRCLQISADGADVRNLTFTGGNLANGSSWGAAVYQTGSYYGVLTNCVFRGNTAVRVGAVYQIKCVDCLFKENTASNCGGYRGRATEKAGAWSCDFLNNTGTSSSAFAEYATLNDCLIEGNTGSAGANYNSWSSNCVFRLNTISGGLVCEGLKIDCLFETNTVKFGCVSVGHTTNCVFRGNRNTYQNGMATAAYNERTVHHCQIYDSTNTTYRGGAIAVDSATSNPCRVTDCVISNCTANYGGAFAVGCTYPNSSKTVFGAERLVVENTTVVDFYAAKEGGALYTKFDVNAGGSIDGDGRTFTLFTNCTLKANSAANRYGGVTLAVAKDCRFWDNRKEQTNHNYDGGDAEKSTLIDCELTGGDLSNCSLDRCYIHNATNCYVFKNFCHVTNTLVEGCVPSEGRITYRNANDGTYAPSDYVNCTFVRNTGWFFTGFATNVTSINCAYFSNTNGEGTATDISWAQAKKTDSSHNPTVSFTNCCFGTLAVSVGEIYGANNQLDVSPRFNAGREPDRPYYEPRYSSPLKNHGINVGFTAEDKDLAGNSRLNGTIDVGCYESYIKAKSLIIVFK